MVRRMWVGVWWVVWLVGCAAAPGERVRELQVSEGAPPGTRVGFISDSSSAAPPYLIVPVPGSGVDSDLQVERATGEIRTRVALDRETRPSYSLVAIPRSGDNVRVLVRVLDENDNAPTFPSPSMNIEFPENTPRDFKRTLNPARDMDLDVFNTQRYDIVSGNSDDAFRLSSHRERDGVLYLDLQINGFLDRETVSEYSLMIEASDGGVPPLRGTMTVNITIQDVNDNQPVFNQSRYFASIPENATVGTSVLRVFATDTDAGMNGEVEYSINRRQSDKDTIFRIDPNTGLVSVNRPLDFEAKEVHEIVVAAKDKGAQPLETTAFVSIRVTDVNDNQPTINVIFLSDDATPKISETAQPGEFVARISVHDPDSKTEYSNVNVTLEGGEGHFGLATQDNIIYLVIVSLPIDREEQSNYTLSVIATDTGTPPLHASRTIHLRVTDVNDNAPEFSRAEYHANVLEVADPGTSVFRIQAVDKDEGNNSVISYSIVEQSMSWFQIDTSSGLITTAAHIDCETEPVPRLVVVARDSGTPPLSSTATVLVTIHDVNDNEPIFDQSFYNVTIRENEPKGKCILKVSATDPDCGVNAMVNYTLGDVAGRLSEFQVRSLSGEVCISSQLDYEATHVYEFPVIATDRGGLSTTAMVKIQLVDVNDNLPVFYPAVYNISLREGEPGPVAQVAATDKDSGRFGLLTYRLVSGNDAGIFKVDKNTGELWVARPEAVQRGRTYRVNVSATDGGGLRAERDAEVTLSLLDPSARPPTFPRSRYSFSIKEDASLDTVVGTVSATISGPRKEIRYAISSGDPDGYFIIEPKSGVIRTAAQVDHETHSSLLLNIQAITPDSSYAHTQVLVTIEDVNDNPPEFGSNKVRISVPESVEVGVALYSAQAGDRDSGENGRVSYRLVGGDGFRVDSSSGHVSLTSPLDYETSQRHSLLISATDRGQPPLSANLSLLIEVQDVNDNPPVFERPEYSVPVSESLPLNSQVVQVTAVDLDTGNNARLTYKLLGDAPEFGMFPNSGWLYLKRALDRETRSEYKLRVAALDNGSPPATATAVITVKVEDANDNPPAFIHSEGYVFSVEENLPRGSLVGQVSAKDPDLGENAAVRYSLIPSNSSFLINPITGDLTTSRVLDREERSEYELVVEARDGGSPARSSRARLKVSVTDVNDNAPEMVDPREDVVSVREEQPPGTEVVRVRAIDRDQGTNASLTYSLLKGDSEGWGSFTMDPVSGVVRTRVVLDHSERPVYRLSVAASDQGSPPRQTVRTLRVEVLAINDNRPTFSSSSLHFKVGEDVEVGYVVGGVVSSDGAEETGRASGGHVTYTLTSVSPQESAFDLDRSSGSLVVARNLDRELCSEYRLEVRALDTSTTNNPQSSAVVVTIQVTDVNDNPPLWDKEMVELEISEDSQVGSSVWNFSASDADVGPNSDVRYSLVSCEPETSSFAVDKLTGSLILSEPLDREATSNYIVVVKATDQATNITQRLSSSLTAKIFVRDVNDNAPTFVYPVSTTIWARGGPERDLTQLVALDPDAAENGRVTYTISSGNNDDLFSLDYSTGVLSVIRPLDPGSRYSLNVTASDLGHPAKHAILSLSVRAHSGALSPPKFQQPRYVANISEDASHGSFVVRVLAKSSSDSGSIRYRLGGGIDGFTIGEETGIVRLETKLDRETKSWYKLAVLAEASSRQTSAELYITVTDSNDHAPSLGPCRPLVIPENSEPSVIHRFVAFDPDLGNNARITYSITGGNVGNRFRLDLGTGELSARALDRESQGRYILTVTAEDGGQLTGSCNLTVIVEDVNDNDPVFEEAQYRGRVAEDASPGTSVLRSRASDPDLGPNGKILYSLANQTHSLFTIDNKTGVIYTIGSFDREKQNIYEFEVVATDNGRYDTRSRRVPVTITITDVNDNKPKFDQYPFIGNLSSYTRPGQDLVRVVATDSDEGPNADIVYSLSGSESRFRINPRTGVVSVASSLPLDTGSEIFRVNVIATDKGNPPRSSTGLVEIRVGDGTRSAPLLRFHNSTYFANVQENSPRGTQVIQVSAVRADGRRQKISYSIGAGNEDNKFTINSATGTITVDNWESLDYETTPRVTLVVVATALVSSENSVYGYCEVIVQLLDENDNSPKFTQDLYYASVWEGNNKGNFVMQVSAVDVDQGRNAHLLYHIVDGNHDNAFVIEPPFSGVVKTNIVLDREIRDSYRLTVIATDEGVPQHTGTATIKINIVDVNDNQPTFPPHTVISVNEGKKTGSVLTAVTANDVDTNPALTYNLLDNADGYFSIDRFSGQVILCRPLDFETSREYTLNISASDSLHLANTLLTVKVTDDNDNVPQFQRSFYSAFLPENIDPGQALLTVQATDLDTGKNSEVLYSLTSPVDGFSIDEKTGEITVNRSSVRIPDNSPNRVIDFGVKATDGGRPPLFSTASIRITVEDSNMARSYFIKNEFKVFLKENIKVGTSVVKMAPESALDVPLASKYHIVDGNNNGAFQVISAYGELVLVKALDRETQDTYTLTIAHGTDNSSSATVYITIEDVNDNSPKFKPFEENIPLMESVPIGHVVTQFKAFDDDLPPNSDIRFDIVSGNDRDLFEMDSYNGKLKVKNKLDFDGGFNTFMLVVSVTDGGREPDLPLTTVASVKIQLQDENDNVPKFPVLEYLEFVGENEPVGSTVFAARATDMDLGVYGTISYSIESAAASGYTDIEDSWKLFKVDSATGVVTTNSLFDYETRSRYAFTLSATDIGGLATRVKVRVEIESRDEFHPQFTERTYKFSINHYDLPTGFVIGHVVATDRDKGPDGRIVYQLSNQHPYFKVNRTTGAILLKKKIDLNFDTSQEISFVVTASSGRQGSLTNMTVVEITLDPLAGRDTNLINGKDNNTALTASTGGVADWAVGLLITLILIILSFGAVFLFLHVRNRRNKNINKPGLGGPNPDYVDPSAFDTIPIRGGVSGAQYGPPKYEEIPTYRNAKSNSSNSGAGTTSQLGSDQSGSSGRGSAEDGEDVEDEEIRMINEGVQREGIREDNMSDVSNTQEYLARLGIVDKKSESASSRRHDSVAGSSGKDVMIHPDIPLEGLFVDESAEEADFRNLIYSKLAEVGSERGSEDGRVIGLRGFPQPTVGAPLSSLVHCEEELAGSYNWDYLLDWGSQYQPIAHVFNEIARLKDDAASVKSATSGASSGKGKATKPPPLLTSVAPRSIAAPRSHPKTHPHPRSPPSSTVSSSPIVTPRLPSTHPLRNVTAETELRI